MQDLNDKVTGNSLTAPEWDQVPSELQNIIEKTGQVLSGADLDQVGKGVSAYGAGGAIIYTAAGTGDAIVLNPSSTYVKPPTLFTGMDVCFFATATNTTNVTINAGGTGVKSALLETGAQLPANSIVTGFYYVFKYNGSNYTIKQQLLGGAPSSSGSIPSGYLNGFTLSNNVADSLHDINIAVGSTKDSTGTQDMILATAIGKQIDVTWADGGTVGAPTGGRAAGVSLTNDTWYHVFAIVKASGVVNVGFDTSATAANLMSTAAVVSALYVKYRHIGYIRYGTATILQFIQKGRNFTLNNGLQISTTAVGTASRVLYTAMAPNDTNVVSAGSFSFFSNSSGGAVRFVCVSPTAVADAAASSGNCTHTYSEPPSTNNQYNFNYNVQMDASSQFGIRVSGSIISLTSVNSLGWSDFNL